MKLATWHESSGLTVAAAATRCGVHRVSYHRYLSAVRMPSHAVVRRIEAVTGGAVRYADLRSANAAWQERQD